MEHIEAAIIKSKGWRQRLDAILQEMKEEQRSARDPQLVQVLPAESGRHLALSVTHLEDAIMRQGMRLKALNEAQPGIAPNPYPSSYDPTSTKVEPTPEGLKL